MSNKRGGGTLNGEVFNYLLFEEFPCIASFSPVEDFAKEGERGVLVHVCKDPKMTKKYGLERMERRNARSYLF